MRNHWANVLISGSGIGQLCEKYLSKPYFSYVHLTSSTNSSGLLPAPLALAACLKCYKTHGGCSPCWLFMGVLKSWIPPPPVLFLVVHVLGKLLLHVLCLPGVHQLRALQCVVTSRVSPGFGEPPQTHAPASLTAFVLFCIYTPCP